MDHNPAVEALRRELLSTGSASADAATLPITAEEWRAAARSIARAQGRTVRTFSGSTLHALLTDWPANDAEKAALARRLRRSIPTSPPFD